MINQTLVDLLNNSSICLPKAYVKAFPQESVSSVDFVPNSYFELLSCFANADQTFEYFKTLANILVNRPYNPLYADELLLDSLKNVLGIQFIVENLTIPALRNVLYAKLLANINNGTINSTKEVYKALMSASRVFRVRLGFVSTAISYCSIGGTLPISLDELATFWEEAKTGGIYIELSQAPLDYFGFAEDSGALGFSSTEGGQIVQAPLPYFGFYEDPLDTATGFSTIDAPNSGGMFPVLVDLVNSGGSFASIIYTQTQGD